jgi:hypothetical protein
LGFLRSTIPPSIKPLRCEQYASNLLRGYAPRDQLIEFS